VNIADRVKQELQQGNTVVILDGVTPEQAGVEKEMKGADPAFLNRDPMGYFSAAVLQQKRRVFFYEEYAVLRAFFLVQFQRILLLHNNLYMNLRPISFPLEPDMEQALLAHFSTEEGNGDDKISLEPVSKLIGAYSGYTKIQGQPWGVYFEDNDDASQVVHENVYDETKAASRKNFRYQKAQAVKHILDEEDYVELLLEYQRTGQLPVLRIADYTGDKDRLELHLHILELASGLQVVLAEEASPEPGFEHREAYTDILKKYWKHPSFREFPVYDLKALQDPVQPHKAVKLVSQEAVIADLVTQVERCGKGEQPRDLFVTASTGAGKSVMFQVPAIYLAQSREKLLTLVISPLIGLMRDQVEGLERRGYHGARTINSDISPVIKTEIMEKVKEGEYDILYLSPETLLARSDVEQLIGDRTIGMIIIDEAHIVTTWGKQFRPDYWYLGDHIRKIRKQQLQKKQRDLVIATFTATAIYHGREDMYGETIDSLHMIDPITYLGYVRRKDITIQVERKPVRTGRHEYELDKFDALLKIMTRAQLLQEKTLIYFPTVSLITRFDEYLRSGTGHKRLADVTTTYHGQLEKLEKEEHYRQYLAGERTIMLATKAFGMGIDIEDIVNVIHFAPTGNVCDYVQEIGRAARKPGLQGKAIYEFDKGDFKFINRLHGLSTIRPDQLVSIISKIRKLYSAQVHQNLAGYTRKRNAMLLDAGNFSYLFDNPMNDESDTINKVKTALLMIQKDFERGRGFSPITVRPVPMFAMGYFQIQPTAQQRLQKKFHQVLKEVDSHQHICRVNLEKIWNEGENQRMSFPKFKYLLYSGDKSLDFNQQYNLQPACHIRVQLKKDGYAIFQTSWKAVKDFAYAHSTKDDFVSMDQLVDALGQSGLMDGHRYRLQNFCEVLLASINTYRREFTKELQSIMSIRVTRSGRETFQFRSAIRHYFQWVEKGKNQIFGQTDGDLYLVNRKGSSDLKAISTVLGILEAMGVLDFEILGGDSDQLYIYVNQEQALRNIANKPEAYRNGLLEEVQQRHRLSVQLLTYMFENSFTSEELWDIIEDYFLGKLPDGLIQSSVGRK